jgi:hypothetical protein
LVGEALDGDRLVGMTLLRPGWQDHYEGRPPVYQTGCAGLITHADRLPDGRFNIVLRGLTRFRITGEEPGRAFRVASVESLQDPVSEADRAALRDQRHRLEALLASVIEGGEPPFPATMPDEDLVNALAQYLPLEPIERQALLEKPGPVARGDSLVELLEMRVFTGARPWGSGTAH